MDREKVLKELNELDIGEVYWLNRAGCPTSMSDFELLDVMPEQIAEFVSNLIDQANQEKSEAVREVVKKFLPRLTNMDDRSLIVECLQEQEACTHTHKQVVEQANNSTATSKYVERQAKEQDEHVYIKGIPVTGNLAIDLKDGE